MPSPPVGPSAVRSRPVKQGVNARALTPFDAAAVVALGGPVTRRRIWPLRGRIPLTSQARRDSRPAHPQRYTRRHRLSRTLLSKSL